MTVWVYLDSDRSLHMPGSVTRGSTGRAQMRGFARLLIKHLEQVFYIVRPWHQVDVAADLVFLRHRMQVAKRREIFQGKAHGVEHRHLFIALAALDVALRNPEKLDDG